MAGAGLASRAGIVAALGLACLSHAAAAPAVRCGHGPATELALRDGVTDPTAMVVVGIVTAQHVAGGGIMEDRIGTIELDVRRVLRGDSTVHHVIVPARSPKCLPKTACLATAFDLASVGATVIAACSAAPDGAARSAFALADPAAVAGAALCMAIDQPAAHGAHGGLARAYLDGGDLARSCAARMLCDDAHRADSVAALGELIADPSIAADTRLDLGGALLEATGRGESLLGCTGTPPQLFQPGLGGGESTNRQIVRSLLGAMLAATDLTERRRWANAIWDVMVDWYDQPDQQQAVVSALGKLLARRAADALRALGGDDAPHYETIAATLDRAN